MKKSTLIWMQNGESKRDEIDRCLEKLHHQGYSVQAVYEFDTTTEQRAVWRHLLRDVKQSETAQTIIVRDVHGLEILDLSDLQTPWEVCEYQSA